jgi:hypothetical protein
MFGHAIAKHGYDEDKQEALIRDFGENPKSVVVEDIDGYNPILIDRVRMLTVYKWVYVIICFLCLFYDNYERLSWVLAFGLFAPLRLVHGNGSDVMRLKSRDEQLRERIMMLENKINGDSQNDDDYSLHEKDKDDHDQDDNHDEL